jgi:hypothetical protein
MRCKSTGQDIHVRVIARGLDNAFDTAYLMAYYWMDGSQVFWTTMYEMRRLFIVELHEVIEFEKNLLQDI